MDWISFVAIALAAITVVANILSVRSAANSNKSLVYLEISYRYTSEEMSAALKVLGDFGRKSKARRESLEACYDNIKLENSDELEQIIKSIRIVGLHFNNIAKMYEVGIMPRKIAQSLIYHPGLNIYYEICVPIYIHREQNAITRHSIVLKRMLKVYEKGIY